MKEIIESETKNVKVALFILRNIKSGLNCQDAILNKNPDLEFSDKEWMINRMKIKSYLKKLYLGIFFQNK